MTVLGVVKNGHARCPQCRYMRRETDTVVRWDDKHICADEERCLANRRERDRLDSWKGRDEHRDR